MSRSVVEKLKALPSSDGDGVKLLRVFGGARPERFDPFLLMDEFGSDDAADYIGGFPPHPHRGFETITYMLQGKMEHRDHMGNVGLLKDGDVQWMSAARGVIHSEMPQQTEGKMRGFQIWLNLPASQKLKPAAYQDIAGSQLPRVSLRHASVSLIAGELTINDQAHSGYIDSGKTQAVVADIHLSAGEVIELSVSDKHRTMVYAYEGELAAGNEDTPLNKQQLVRMEGTGSVLLKNMGAAEARLMFLAGIPLEEPIVQYGPFVMNTQEEINVAIAEYQRGELTA